MTRFWANFYAYLTSNHDINEIAGKLNLDVIYVIDSGIVASNGNDDKIKEIREPIDDRTLFLIFSKGYLIFENELREFFMRHPFTILVKQIIYNIILFC